MQRIPVPALRIPDRRGFVQIASAVAISAAVATAAWLWLRSGDQTTASQRHVTDQKAATTTPRVTAALSQERVIAPSSGESAAAKVPNKSVRSPDSGTAGVSQPSVDDPTLSDDRLRELIIGRWEIERTGLRRLEIRDDGTATMVVILPEIWQLVFGEKLTFDIEWTIDDGVLTYETVGGEPKDKFETITKIYGRVRKQAVIDMTAERMLLEDDEDGPPHDWKRLTAP